MTNALLAWLLSLSAASGTVTYITSAEGYVDADVTDGVDVGDTLKVFRRKRQVGTCEVVEVSVAGARCKSDRLVPGDRVVFKAQKADEGGGRSPRPTSVNAGPRANRRDEREKAALRKLLAAAPIEQRAHKKTGVAALPVRGSALLRQQVWSLSTAPAGIFSRSSLDAAVRASVDVGFAPLIVTGAARVSGDLFAPETQRFRRGELVELYLWNAAVSLEEGPVVGSLGRFRPRLAPGVTLIDGVQAGTRLFDDTAEVGAYAGAVPDLTTLLPSINRLTAGAYFGVDLEATPGVVLLPRARASVSSTADLSVLRGELEVQTELFWARVLYGGASVRTGIGGTADNLPSLDAARADFSLSVIEPLTLQMGYRFRAAPVVDFDAGAIALGARSLGAAHQGGGTLSYAIYDGIAVGVNAGAGYDVDSDSGRAWAGPELSLPNALGPFGGLVFGYLEELGTLPGRSAYMSLRAEAGGVHYGGRTSYFEHEALGDSYREAGLMVLVDAPLFPWLTLRGRGYAQQAFGHVGGLPRPTPTLLMADVGVLGTWR